ncbi:MAG: 50S ribosomal protein L24 [Gammaproteobacteria bacterium 39-13]|jgi:large subunit ribosomal protein L24|nr:50S ribosomal protein L24 [Gammaproteobacteria bacterium]OJV92086.1 MAG: 50S ribosomal protein L24 [Gammaproteobacteria bacterium 39-13]
MRKIRKGDKVQVISGKDKGRIGTVLSVLQAEAGLSVIVEGINVKKKHVKPNPQREQPGGIVPKEAPMPACKVALLDPTTNKPSRVGVKLLEDGKKVRVFRSSGEVVDV